MNFIKTPLPPGPRLRGGGGGGGVKDFMMFIWVRSNQLAWLRQRGNYKHIIRDYGFVKSFIGQFPFCLEFMLN